MSVRIFLCAVFAGIMGAAAAAENGRITNLASSPELWKANAGREASVPPEMSVIKGPDGSPAVEFTVKADGVYQGAELIPEAPIVLEPGDILKMKLRQTAEKEPVAITLNGQFACGTMNTVTKPVANKWTEITVALDPANWRSSNTPKELGALKRLAIYPARRLDQTGEVLSIAEMQIVKADGSLRSVPVPESRRPTEAELRWLGAENWKGARGNLSVKTAPEITFEDTPEGKAVYARPVVAGPYQGLELNLPETIDLAQVKAITFDVMHNTGSGSCCLWLNYADGGGVRCDVRARNREWTQVRVQLDYNPQTFTAKVKGQTPAPGMLRQVVLNCNGSLDAPGEELAVRNVHLIRKSAE